VRSSIVPISGEAVAEGDPSALAAREVLRDAGVEVSRIVTIGARGEARIDGVVVHGGSAMAAWEALRAASARTGWHPVVIGDEQGVEAVREGLDAEDAPSVEDVLAEAARLEPERVLGEHRAEHLASGEGEVPHEEWSDEDERITEEGAAEVRFHAGRDVLSGEPLPEVAIALLPTRDGADAPAWLGLGGWNECPSAAEHVALLRRWRERWGAEVVAASGDTIELAVSEPPRDVGAARALAEEQYAYAPDIVDQGTGSIERLAASLVGGRVWFFWWE
jgi:hypothetical protein